MRFHTWLAVITASAFSCADGEPPPDSPCGEGGADAGADVPGVAPRCFGLDPEIYDTSARTCWDVMPGSIVVACVDDMPPPSQCVALHQDLDREVRYCCCDPRKDPSCDVVP